MADSIKLNKRSNQQFQIIAWSNIVSQLSTTQANRALGDNDLPYSQFVVLYHFYAQQETSHTVVSVARAFQQPQPGTTKTIQKLEIKRLLVSKAHPSDGRAKLFSITAKGRRAFEKAQKSLAPLLDRTFDGWTDKQLNELFVHLDRIKVLLDDNRE